jgi:hypothetical protein
MPEKPIIPDDPRDIAFLRIAEGLTVGDTTFPSGWKCPPGPFVVRAGKLVPKPQ